MFGNTKGGVGKTTLALNFTLEQARENKNIKLVDLDSRKSTYGMFNQFRAEAGLEINYEIVSDVTSRAELSQFYNDVYNIDKDRIIIDTGGINNDINALAFYIADIVIVPVLANVGDINVAKDYFKLLNLFATAGNQQGKKSIYIIINRLGGTYENKFTDAKDALNNIIKNGDFDNLDIVVMDKFVHDTEGFNKSFRQGMGILELTTNADISNHAKNSFIRFYDTIKNILEKKG